MTILLIGEPSRYQGVADRLNQSKEPNNFVMAETIPETHSHDFLIDLSQPSPALALARENKHPQYIELVVELDPKASELGYVCYVGGDFYLIEQLKPYFDQLSYLPGAWLYCGPVGAATFCHQVMQTLRHFTLLSTPGLLSDVTSLENYATHTHRVIQQLHLLAQRYLLTYPIQDTLPDPIEMGFPIPANFEQSTHYSLALAHWLEVTLTRLQSFAK